MLPDQPRCSDTSCLLPAWVFRVLSPRCCVMCIYLHSLAPCMRIYMGSPWGTLLYSLLSFQHLLLILVHSNFERLIFGMNEGRECEKNRSQTKHLTGPVIQCRFGDKWASPKGYGFLATRCIVCLRSPLRKKDVYALCSWNRRRGEVLWLVFDRHWYWKILGCR